MDKEELARESILPYSATFCDTFIYVRDITRTHSARLVWNMFEMETYMEWNG